MEVPGAPENVKQINAFSGGGGSRLATRLPVLGRTP